MRFWWPDWQPRERSPSTDSECSTASHSSLASDASFYSAASDGAGAAELADVRAGADPLGLRLRIGDPPAPVLGSAGAENGPGDPPRAAPLLGTGEELAGATSGTGPRPAAPIAPIAGPRAGPSGGQAEARSAASTSRRFAATASRRGPADRPPGGTGPRSLGRTMPGSRASRAPRGTVATAEEHGLEDAALRRGGRSDGSCAAPTPATDPHARRLAAQDPAAAAPPLLAPPLPPSDVGRPGRAAGRLPVSGAPAAATARAPTGSQGPDDLRRAQDDDGDGDDADGQDDPAAATKPRPDPASVLPRPGRAGGRLADMPTPGAAPAATAAAIAEAAVAADAAARTADQVAAQEPVQTTYAHSATEFKCSVCAYVAGNLATLVAHRRSAHRGTRFSDIFDSGCACSLVFHSRMAATSHALACAQRASQAAPSPAEAMDVDQGRVRPRQRRPSPRRPSERRPDGKRRRLNSEDDADAQKPAEHLQLADEDGVEDPPQAHKPYAASALSAPVLAVYVHNAERFTCTLCTFTAASFSSLQRHRTTRHRRAVFQDKFLAGCACGTPFASRPAAAKHAQACAGRSTALPATALPVAGTSSPTAAAANATVAAATVTPDSPQPATPELAASPPLASPTHPEVVEVPEQPSQGRWGPALPRALVAERVAARLGAIPAPRWEPPLPRELVSTRIAARLGEVPAPRWGPPLPRRMVASRIAARLLPPEPTADGETKEDTSADGADLTARDANQEDNPAAAPDRTATAAAMDVDSGTAGEWLLRFDGACRANPGPGGAGAALFKPDGSVVWTCSHYMPSSSETNNTAEYSALLLEAPRPRGRVLRPCTPCRAAHERPGILA
ncbi:hypothetical protein PHYSODRAFT_334511 [Phytophthora sojae]|uniref:Uncharacterized protein n=1 Tax=Phytophthora sojae (strain P6497) TaxID=1094619 RepID=G4ZPK5_PHYSP|nr:hypothetical protein PHYSODRAFT_334511 [Phytophthora sojae]EGZ16317.1 hypothetical protein PHYSODRAFT_334511 [Phytophthora sojae]|eukprot:XP_009530066.1 hypothetical protein PHYSODRAFT_334511 [Phytophthora sojae]